jgi:O-antigen ligase
VFTLGLSVIGVEQWLAPKVCYIAGETTATGAGDKLDGRPCSTNDSCREGGVPSNEYLCEHPGMFDTHSIVGRVRFRGILEDPNELAWAISMGVPLAFGLFERKRTRGRLALLIGIVVLGGMCVVFTKSRSGQLSLMAVFGVYFLRRFGWRGALAGAILSLPLLLLGGRTGAEADSSSEERLGCWAAALDMWRENPLMGVGEGQFTQHHYLTAHNSFLLTLAELGPLGILLFSGSLFMATKIAIRAQIDLAGRPDAAVARSWATALLASLAGLIISAAFLSIAYHALLWVFLGLAGALYAGIRKHDPEFRVRFGLRDMALVFAADTVLVAAIALYIRIKGI